MSTNWQKFKERYIRLHGESAYHAHISEVSKRKRDRLKRRIGIKKFRELNNKWNRNSHRKNPLTNMLTSAKKRAKRKGLEFSLNRENISIPEKCPILGIPLFTNPKGVRGACDNSPTIDRLDNNKGYTPENCRVISWIANKIKNIATPEQLIKIANYVQTELEKPK